MGIIFKSATKWYFIGRNGVLVLFLPSWSKFFILVVLISKMFYDDVLYDLHPFRLWVSSWR